MKLALSSMIVMSMAWTGAALAQDGGTEETLKAKVVETKAAAPAAVPAAATTPAAAATGGLSSTVCTNGGNRRSVILTSTNATTNLPCEVHYKKESEQPGHDQVLWAATTDLAFCEQKAQDFVDKLTSWGWTCAKN